MTLVYNDIWLILVLLSFFGNVSVRESWVSCVATATALQGRDARPWSGPQASGLRLGQKKRRTLHVPPAAAEL
ncbi:hypothetical protein F5148DRAFT_1206077, partial [Russula earlei]